MDSERKNDTSRAKARVITNIENKSLSRRAVVLGLGATVLSALLASCTADNNGKPQTITPKEEEPPIEVLRRSPFVLCHNPTEPEHPSALLFVTFLEIIDQNGNKKVAKYTSITAGDPRFAPDENGKLSPVKTKDSSFVNTGLKADFFYEYKTVEGTEEMIMIDLGGCLVAENEKNSLKEFFESIKPLWLDQIDGQEASASDQRLQLVNIIDIVELSSHQT